jgi:hypothetical protein
MKHKLAWPPSVGAEAEVADATLLSTCEVASQKLMPPENAKQRAVGNISKRGLVAYVIEEGGTCLLCN